MIDAKTIAVSRKLGGGGGGGGSDLARQIMDGTVTEVSDDTVTALKNNAFDGCTMLAKVNLPNLKKISQYAFKGCALVAVVFPAATQVETNAFYLCKEVKTIDLPACSAISTFAFRECTSLANLILRREDKVCTLGANAMHMSSFSNSGSGGKLFVPAARLESYKTAAEWSTIYGYGTNQFLALEDYTVGGTTTGAIDWDKVNAL